MGVAFERPEIIKGETSIGYRRRNYDDPTLPNISGLLVDSSLVWKATPLTKVTLAVTSTIGESTLTGASGVFTHEAKIIVDHAFRRWLIGSAFASYGIDDYRGIGRVDHRFAYGGALTYYLNRSLALRGELRQERQLRMPRAKLHGERRDDRAAPAALSGCVRKSYFRLDCA